MYHVRAGDVVVVDARGAMDSGVFGEMMMTYLKGRGGAGVVVDGCLRDWPRIRELGLIIPDPNLSFDDATGRWAYTEPDWAELKSVVTGHGPASQERLGFRREVFVDTQWVRDALLGNATAAA